MQAIFEACKVSVLQTTQACSTTKVYKEECLKLGRYVAKVALLMAELELWMIDDDLLRGSQSLFLAGEAVVGAIQQAEDLARQCVDTGAARIWPMEDAIEFQSVAVELLDAVTSTCVVCASSLFFISLVFDNWYWDNN